MSIQVYNGLALYPIAADLGELQTRDITAWAERRENYAEEEKLRETRALCFRDLQ